MRQRDPHRGPHLARVPSHTLFLHSRASAIPPLPRLYMDLHETDILAEDGEIVPTTALICSLDALSHLLTPPSMRFEPFSQAHSRRHVCHI
ncbi:hypothetical protein M413DRAFT_444348 [Hebeloma cylindrosporum]|uniref:Uncharacterized protein n=1 Tax=Hebeloma cylindrosporum TaxID=76867 RepID=A0A0C3CEQ9_HEBCY|nr:hypothetical protein M413DRAFT_444348 [Hebeloma cylindrosporum h7]